MCCVVALAAFIGPRFAIFAWWLLDPLRWAASFDGPILPVLGFLFLPWTTLTFVWLAPNGIHGFDVVWLLIALVIDASSYGGGRYAQVR